MLLSYIFCILFSAEEIIQRQHELTLTDTFDELLIWLGGDC